ncbi:hypothetical protein ACQ5SK_23770 [Bradyrhizobium japonicum]
MRHQLAVELDLVAGVDSLLPVERQAIGIFGDGDLGQKRFRRLRRPPSQVPAHHLDIRSGVSVGRGDLSMAKPSLNRQEVHA